MNSNIKRIIVIALIISVAAAAAIYAQPAPANNTTNNTSTGTWKGVNYDPNNPNCRANGGPGMGTGRGRGAGNGQGSAYGGGYGRHAGRRGTGNGCAGCSSTVMLPAYQKYAGDPDFARMLQEKDALRLSHRKQAETRREAHRVETRNIVLSYSQKINAAKTDTEKSNLTAEMNKALDEKRTAYRNSSTTFRTNHLKQVTTLESKYSAKFPDYFKNRGNCQGVRKGTGGNGRGRGNGGRGCPGC